MKNEFVRILSESVWYCARTKTLGVYTVWSDGVACFEIDGSSGPVKGHPTDWDLAWKYVGEL